MDSSEPFDYMAAIEQIRKESRQSKTRLRAPDPVRIQIQKSWQGYGRGIKNGALENQGLHVRETGLEELGKGSTIKHSRSQMVNLATQYFSFQTSVISNEKP